MEYEGMKKKTLDNIKFVNTSTVGLIVSICPFCLYRFEEMVLLLLPLLSSKL